MYALMQNVLEFHQKMGQAIGDPRKPDLSVQTQLRWDLIHEEFQELTLALKGETKDGSKISGQEQLIAVADGLGDLAYVIAGAGVTWGIELGSVCEEIHRSNMTKTPGNRREDGKILKGPNYTPPDLDTVFKDNAEEAEEIGFGEYSWWPVPTVDSGLPIKLAPEVPDESRTCPVTGHECVSDKCGQQCQAQKLDIPLNGVFLARGAFVFDCPCNRQHEVNLNNGTRGGRIKTAESSCLCGKSFHFEFGIEGDHDTVQVQIS